MADDAASSASETHVPTTGRTFAVEEAANPSTQTLISPLKCKQRPPKGFRDKGAETKFNKTLLKREKLPI